MNSKKPVAHYIAGVSEGGASEYYTWYNTGLGINGQKKSVKEVHEILWENGIEKYDFVLLEGVCKFGLDKLVVTIDKKSDKIFNGKYGEITFERIPEDENDE